MSIWEELRNWTTFCQFIHKILSKATFIVLSFCPSRINWRILLFLYINLFLFIIIIIFKTTSAPNSARLMNKGRLRGRLIGRIWEKIISVSKNICLIELILYHFIIHRLEIKNEILQTRSLHAFCFCRSRGLCWLFLVQILSNLFGRFRFIVIMTPSTSINHFHTSDFSFMLLFF